jgi:hypothetical protein
MYCIVCLQNRAREFYCPYCGPKIEQVLRHDKMTVTEQTQQLFNKLSMPQQKYVIYLTNKRLGKALKSGVYKETDFRIDILIREYSEMAYKNQQLEIPYDTYKENRRSYHQYITPKGA